MLRSTAGIAAPEEETVAVRDPASRGAPSAARRTRKVTTIDLRELKDFTYECSLGGNALGFGASTMESGGRINTLIDYISFPEQIYLEIRGTLDEKDPSGYFKR